MTRVDGLNRVRALAALSVFAAHIVMPKLPEPFSYILTGHPAVIAFFVVSGLCIHYPYVNERLYVLPFLVGRYIRIGVPLAVALAWGYTDPAVRARGFNLVEGFIIWSLVCELIYYSLYPLLRHLAKLSSWGTLLMLSIAASYAVVAVYGTNWRGDANVYGPQLNWVVSLPAWLLGCILAERVAESDREQSGRTTLWLLRVIVAVSASVLLWLTLTTSVGFYLTMVPYSFLCYAWIKAEISAEQSTPILDHIGQWSYSIYLFHIPAVYALKVLVPQPVALALVLPVCFLMYIVVEKPSHELARIVRRRLTPARPLSA